MEGPCIFMKFVLLILLVVAARAETLHYAINWPSGLSLGEATLTSSGIAASSGPNNFAGHWSFDLAIDASLPGFALRDHYKSSAGAGLCSEQLDKTTMHGKHQSEERIVFDQHNSTVTRESVNGGGKSQISVSTCSRDALAFLQFARSELAQGRIAPEQDVIFGGSYQVRLQYTGAQTVNVGERQIATDHMLATIKGPASDITVEIYFARDAARTPVLAKVPVELGTFTVELSR
jgi:hypothetical protein